MVHTVYSIKRFGPIWNWRIVQGAAAPAGGLALSKGGARRAARNRVRNAQQRLEQPDPKIGAPQGGAEAR